MGATIFKFHYVNLKKFKFHFFLLKVKTTLI